MIDKWMIVLCVCVCASACMCITGRTGPTLRGRKILRGEEGGKTESNGIHVTEGQKWGLCEGSEVTSRGQGTVQKAEKEAAKNKEK